VPSAGFGGRKLKAGVNAGHRRLFLDKPSRAPTGSVVVHWSRPHAEAAASTALDTGAASPPPGCDEGPEATFARWRNDRSYAPACVERAPGIHRFEAAFQTTMTTKMVEHARRRIVESTAVVIALYLSRGRKDAHCDGEGVRPVRRRSERLFSILFTLLAASCSLAAAAELCRRYALGWWRCPC